MNRIIEDVGLVELPTGITAEERTHHAASLNELLELMTTMLVFASIRSTGRLPSLRAAVADGVSAAALDPIASSPLPTTLRFEGRFVSSVLGMWDRHTSRDPASAATYIVVAAREYVLGVAARTLVGAIVSGDPVSIARELSAGERVISVTHGSTGVGPRR